MTNTIGIHIVYSSMIYDYVKVMKIFIFGLVIAFFIFKIGFWSSAYSNTVVLGPMQKTIGDISASECREILNNGNVLEYPGDRDSMWTIIYNNKEYFVQKFEVSRATGMSGQLPTMAYTCHGAQELILSE